MIGVTGPVALALSAITLYGSVLWQPLGQADGAASPAPGEPADDNASEDAGSEDANATDADTGGAASGDTGLGGAGPCETACCECDDDEQFERILFLHTTLGIAALFNLNATSEEAVHARVALGPILAQWPRIPGRPEWRKSTLGVGAVAGLTYASVCGQNFNLLELGLEVFGLMPVADYLALRLSASGGAVSAGEVACPNQSESTGAGAGVSLGLGMEFAAFTSFGLFTFGATPFFARTDDDAFFVVPVHVGYSF